MDVGMLVFMRSRLVRGMREGIYVTDPIAHPRKK